MDILINVFNDFKEIVFLENTLKEWGLFLLILLGIILVFKIFFLGISFRLKNLAKKTTTDIDDFIIQLLENVRPPIYYIVAFYLATRFLNIVDFLDKIIYLFFVVVVVWQAVSIVLGIIDYVLNIQIKNVGKVNAGQKTILKFLKQVIKGVVWVIGSLTILANMGVDITSLIAGLGIGGLAIALALKNILTDIFSSFSILIDKPFVVGDYIGLNDKQQGTVKKIGIKTTRLETRDGQELIIANKKLTEQIIQNFRGKGSKKKRNISFIIGVTYETSAEKLELIPNLVKNIIKKQENANLEKIAFDNFGDFSLNFKVVIAINEKEGVKVTNVKNNINYAIFKSFAKENIDFAYPTQTVFVKK